MEIISVGAFSCSKVSFFRVLHCILGWFLVFSRCPLLPHRLSSGFCPSRKSNIKQTRGKGWVTRPYSKCCELWTAKPGIRQELGFQQHGKAWAHRPEDEVFCLVSAAGCCARPAQSPACLDYPFYSGLKTACKFFYHSFLDCVECIVASPCLFPHLFSKLITFMLLGSLKALCLFPSREFIFLSFELMQQFHQMMIYFRKITIYPFFLHVTCC